MRKTIQQLAVGATLLLNFSAQAQCPVITCSSDIVAPADSAMCDAIVTYAMPTATDGCGPTTSQTFTYTGAMETFTVPAGITSITVDAYGAQGGSNSPTNVNYGGYVQADLPVTPGTTIYVYVGEQATTLAGGWNGGGAGESAGKGGGGASDLRIGGTALTDRVIVAGGAGGGGFWSGQEVHGGLGGDLVGGPGYRTDLTNPGGDPGTQTSSGNGTCASFNNPICAGGFGFGGAPSGCGCEGYGGGGGWYGGAGSGNCRGGGGGSSYTDPSATNITHTQGIRIGNGEITITWAGASVPVTQIAGLPSGAAFPVGTTINTFVAESLGGADTCSISVTVVDDQIPSIVCPGNITICQGDQIANSNPNTNDNCVGETVTYVCTGATTTAGSNNIDGVAFNSGATTVWYTVTDAAGNQDSCSFEVTVNPLPFVLIDAFSPDTICDYNGAVSVPVATPPPGTYSGTGVSGTTFDPAMSGIGTFVVTYTTTDTVGCTNSASTSIVVDGCAGTEELSGLSTFTVYPNPSKGLYTVSFGTQTGQVNYAIHAVDGRTIKTGTTNSENELTIDLQNEQIGVYMLQLNDGASTQTITLIKE